MTDKGFTRRRIRAAAAALSLLLAHGELTAQEGAVQRVHDPVIAEEKGIYYVFCTGKGIPVRCSKDLHHWEQAGQVFSDSVPAWAKKEIPGAHDVWAPDISFYNGRFHLYYSVSTLGSQRSCIGLATNATLNPAAKGYKWVDHGKVIESFPNRADYNCIDPNLVIDEHNKPWLVFGSYWGGLKLIALDAATGKPASANPEVRALAARPPNGPIEGAFLVRKGKYYYLFASIDYCCRGVASDYKVVVGRSAKLTGPYVDFDNRQMLEGGGTLVLAGYGHCRGPGHHGMLLGKDGDWIVHHMYDAGRSGTPTMQIRPLWWGPDGWPMVGEPLDGKALPPRKISVPDLIGVWSHSVDFAAEDYFQLLPGGRLHSALPESKWSYDGGTLRLHWPTPGAPGGAWVDVCFVGPDGRSYVGRNQRGNLVRGTRCPSKD